MMGVSSDDSVGWMKFIQADKHLDPADAFSLMMILFVTEYLDQVKLRGADFQAIYEDYLKRKKNNEKVGEEGKKGQ